MVETEKTQNVGRNYIFTHSGERGGVDVKGERTSYIYVFRAYVWFILIVHMYAWLLQPMYVDQVYSRKSANEKEKPHRVAGK